MSFEPGMDEATRNAIIAAKDGSRNPRTPDAMMQSLQDQKTEVHQSYMQNLFTKIQGFFRPKQ